MQQYNTMAQQAKKDVKPGRMDQTEGQSGHISATDNS